MCRTLDRCVVLHHMCLISFLCVCVSSCPSRNSDVGNGLVVDRRAYDDVIVENAASFGCSVCCGFGTGLILFEEVLDVRSVDSPGDGQNSGGLVDYD